MIYCYKKLRELKLLHIFVLHYLTAAVIGTLLILFLFWLGNGLELYSAVVLCLMYGQPEYLMLRRMEMYKIRAELRDMDCPPCEKAEIVLPIIFCCRPQPDKFMAVNGAVILSAVIEFFLFFGLNRWVPCTGIWGVILNVQFGLCCIMPIWLGQFGNVTAIREELI